MGAYRFAMNACSPRRGGCEVPARRWCGVFWRSYELRVSDLSVLCARNGSMDTTFCTPPGISPEIFMWLAVPLAPGN